jgi:hypothetical protein
MNTQTIGAHCEEQPDGTTQQIDPADTGIAVANTPPAMGDDWTYPFWKLAGKWLDADLGKETEITSQALELFVRDLIEQRAAHPALALDFKQSTALLAMFGGERTEITLQIGQGHSGSGLYASYAELPEEGSVFLGESDPEAVPADTRSVRAHPALAAPYGVANDDTARLDWALPILTGEDNPETNRRTVALGLALMLGQDGRTAIDTARASAPAA